MSIVNVMNYTCGYSARTPGWIWGKLTSYIQKKVMLGESHEGDFTQRENFQKLKLSNFLTIKHILLSIKKYIIFYYNTFAHLYIFVLFFTALQQRELILREIFVQIIQMMQTIRMVLKMASFSSYIFFLSWNVVKSRCPVRSVESSRAKATWLYVF